MVVTAWLQRAAAARPDTIALEHPGGGDAPARACTYAELLALARAGAGALAARGATPGERVAIALPAGLDFACALHACLLLGAVAVPVDLRLGERERAAVLDGATVVVDEPLSLDAPAGVALVEHDLDSVAVVIHTSGTTSAPKPVELTYGNFLWSALGSAVALGLLEGGAGDRRSPSRAPPPSDLGGVGDRRSPSRAPPPSDLGGAGDRRPPSRAPLQSNPHERWLCNLPLSHVGGLSILLRSAIYGTTAVMHERFDTEHTLHALTSEGVTLVSLVATTLARLLDAGLERPTTGSAGGAPLRCALTGGGPVPAALLMRARAAGVPVSLTYGLTEACSQVTTQPLAETGTDWGDTRSARIPRSASAAGACLPASMAIAAAPREPGGAPSAGPPLFCTRVRTAADGEIEVAGPTVARGAAAPDGWLRTGDLGTVDRQGCLLVTGRKADTIVSGGENVAPTEVEAVLEEHPGVLEAAAFGRPDERWGEAVTAVVVARAGALLRGEELRAHCAARLAPYKVPKEVALVEGPLPRTRSGKLLRRELR